MAGFENDVVYAKNADFSQLDNQSASESNGIITNGQLWIGSTAVNAGGTHINVGSITSPGSTVTIGYSSPNITLDIAGGMAAVEHITGDTGGQLNPTANNFNIIGQDGIKTSGSGSTLTITPRGAGTANMFLGQGAGNATLTGANNVGYGATVLPALTSGLENTCIGTNSGALIQSGRDNTAVGATSLSANVSGQYNVAIGSNALAAFTGSNCIGIGATAAGSIVSSTKVVAIGFTSIQSATGSATTTLGFAAGQALTSGDNNIFIGSQAAINLLTGANNTIIGTDAASAYVGAESSNIIIKNAGTAAETNAIHIGTQGSGAGQQNTCFVAGITGVTVSNAAPVYLNTSTGQLGQGTATNAMTWTDVTGATQTLAVGNGYFTDRGGGVTYTLPSTAALGDIIKIDGKLGLATIAQNANQAIRVGSALSTTGVGGSVAATNVGDCMTLRCSTAGASTIWVAENFVGNWTVT